MKKTGVVILVALMTLIALYPSVSAYDAGVIVDQEIVTISLSNNGLQVDETIRVTNAGSENVTSLRFWIQQNTKETPKIIEQQSGEELVPIITGNIRDCNLSAANLTIQPDDSLTLQLTYYLPSTEQNFIKTLLYDTTIFSVTYKEGATELNLFQGEHLLSNSDENNAIQVRLYKPTEAPLNITILLIVFLVVIIVLALLMLLLRNQRSKTKKSVAESEETLTTRKALLLSLLKDLEKQYRAKSISDETYNKIKDEYKQQAVDAMKKLDDLKK
jgi:hypothetical protein